MYLEAKGFISVFAKNLRIKNGLLTKEVNSEIKVGFLWLGFIFLASDKTFFSKKGNLFWVGPLQNLHLLYPSLNQNCYGCNNN